MIRIEKKKVKNSNPAGSKSHETASNEEDISEVVLPKKGSKLDKDYDSTSEYKGKTTIYYINVDGRKNKPVIKKWKKATVTDGVAEYLNYLEDLGFTITIVNSSHREPYAGFDFYETDFKVTKAGVSWTMYHSIQDEAYVEYELDINLD